MFHEITYIARNLKRLPLKTLHDMYLTVWKEITGKPYIRFRVETYRAQDAQLKLFKRPH